MKRFAKKLCALLAATALAVLLPCAALAAVPARPDDYGTVLDEAEVLSASFEEKLQQKNENLFEKTGSEIAVVCVDFLDGEDIEDYAYDLFNAWGIGSSERNNGLLLLLAIAEENYYALPGYGIEDTFTGSYLQEMLDENLEDDFAAGNYESGVEKFFNAAYTELASYTYSDNITGAQEAEPIDDSDITYVEKTSVISTVATLVGFVARLIVLIVVIVLVIAIVRAAARLNHTPPPPPAGDVVPPQPQRSRFWEGMFVGSMLNHHRRPPRRNPWGAPPPPHQPPHHNPGPRPGGFGSSGRPGGFGGPSRPSRPSGGGFSHGGGSRPSGGRPSGGGFSRGGGSRGGGAGRK